MRYLAKRPAVETSGQLDHGYLFDLPFAVPAGEYGGVDVSPYAPVRAASALERSAPGAVAHNMASIPEGFGPLGRGAWQGLHDNWGEVASSDTTRPWDRNPPLMRESMGPGGGRRRDAGPPVESITLALYRAILDEADHEDDGRKASARHQLAAEVNFRTALATRPAPHIMETEFQQREAATEIACVQFRIEGGDPERGALILGRQWPAGLRLWRPACSACDEIEKDEREAAERVAASEAAKVRIVETQNGPTKRTAAETGSCWHAWESGFVKPHYLEELGAVHVTPGGMHLARTPAIFGLRWPAPRCPGHAVYQGEDVPPVPHFVASARGPQLTDREYLRLAGLLPIDTSLRPREWGVPNKATRRFVEGDLLQMILDAKHAVVRQHYRSCAARGCYGRSDGLARREYEALRRQAYDREVAIQLTCPPHIRDEVVEREVAGLLASLTADYVRAAGPGVVAWGSCVVSAKDEIGAVASGLLGAVRSFFASRTEATSVELASALGLNADSSDLHAACRGRGLGQKSA